jgi:hypothetical protein
MPVKKRLPKEREHRLTTEIIKAFRDGNPAVGFMLGLKPWEPSIWDVTTDEPPSWANYPYADAWPKVRGLRLALEKAARAQ